MNDRLAIVEETFRDGQLSLWATRMDTRTMLGIAAVMDQAGFQRACISSGAAFDTAIKFLNEDPWERLRLLRAEMPRTPIEFLVRGRNVIGWKRYADDVAELFIRCLRRIGFDWMLIFDGLNDFSNIAFHIGCARQQGLKVSCYLSYAVSPVHTDAYWLQKTEELIALGVDVINFGDPAGLLNPERARSLLPQLLATIAGRAQLLLSLHTSTGLALDCYREGLACGVRAFSSCARALSNSESLPWTGDVLKAADEHGIECKVDRAAAATMDDYFDWIAYRDDRPVGRAVRRHSSDYASYLAHQIPGGMMSNFVRQLTEAGQIEKLPQILEEMGRVREELGYPPMVTPWSQLVGVQATLNVISGERYSSVPDEIKLYARGHYGRSPGPIAASALDRLMSKNSEPPTDTRAQDLVSRVRKDHPFATDEELVLRIFYDESALLHIANQRQAREDPVARSPIGALIEAALRKRPSSRFSLSVPVSADDTRAVTYKDVLKTAKAIDAAHPYRRVALKLPSFSLEVASPEGPSESA